MGLTFYTVVSTSIGSLKEQVNAVKKKLLLPADNPGSSVTTIQLPVRLGCRTQGRSKPSDAKILYKPTQGSSGWILGEGSTLSSAAHKAPGMLVTASKERVELQPRCGCEKRQRHSCFCFSLELILTTCYYRMCASHLFGAPGCWRPGVVPLQVQKHPAGNKSRCLARSFLSPLIICQAPSKPLCCRQNKSPGGIW